LGYYERKENPSLKTQKRWGKKSGFKSQGLSIHFKGGKNQEDLNSEGDTLTKGGEGDKIIINLVKNKKLICEKGVNVTLGGRGPSYSYKKKFAKREYGKKFRKEGAAGGDYRNKAKQK